MANSCFGQRWRSLLFVPADQQKLLQKGATRGADAVILDLEDAVVPSAKAGARASLAAAADALARQGVNVLVRINAQPDLMAEDMATLPASVSAVVLPKVEGASDVANAAHAIERREKNLGLRSGTIGLIPLIESPRGLRYAYEIAEAPRVISLSLGTEDFALALGVAPQPDALTLPAQVVCLAAAAAGVMGLALPTSIANFRKLEDWALGARAGRALGATGALCIHPAQIPVLNEVFSPSVEEKAWAKAIVEAWTQATREATGAIAVDGQMVDEPVFRRASATLALCVGR
jgi:citrate lyase subunit beta/citryl-CoA lyase